MPEATRAILLLILHDQFHDSGYWRGAIKLRHLLDLKDALNGQPTLMASKIFAYCPSTLARDAAGLFLLSGKELLGANVDMAETGILPRINVARVELQSAQPALRGSVALVWITFNVARLHAHGKAVRSAGERIGLAPPILDVNARLRRLQHVVTTGS